jgi:hypothetical protein
MRVLIIEPHRLLSADIEDVEQRAEVLQRVLGVSVDKQDIPGPGDPRAYRSVQQPGVELELNALATLFYREHGSLARDEVVSGNVVVLAGDDEANVPDWVTEALQALVPKVQAMGGASMDRPC